MTSGDLMVFVSPNNTSVTLLPAVGVEIVIRAIHSNVAGAFNGYHLTDGVKVTNVASNPAFPGAAINACNLFIAVTNTTYFYIDPFGAGFSSGYSGIQTK